MPRWEGVRGNSAVTMFSCELDQITDEHIEPMAQQLADGVIQVIATRRQAADGTPLWLRVWRPHRWIYAACSDGAGANTATARPGRPRPRGAKNEDAMRRAAIERYDLAEAAPPPAQAARLAESLFVLALLRNNPRETFDLIAPIREHTLWLTPLPDADDALVAELRHAGWLRIDAS